MCQLVRACATRLIGRKYKSGAVGALLHGTILHGVDYSIELEVYADGVGSRSRMLLTFSTS